MTSVPNLEPISTKQQRIAQLAKQMPEQALHSLSHHIDMEWMIEAWSRTRKDGATGIDGQTAQDYEAALEADLNSLLNRAKTGATYRAPPVRRVYLPKGDGSLRPLGIPTLEDKVLQTAIKMRLYQARSQAEFFVC
jgi:retron-type reverse transcriptase